MSTRLAYFIARDADLAAPQPADDHRRHHHRRGVAVRCSAGSCCCRSGRRPRHRAVEARRRARDLHEGRRRPHEPDRRRSQDAARRPRTRNVKSYQYLDQAGRVRRVQEASSADQPDARRTTITPQRPARVVPGGAEARPSSPTTVAERVPERCPGVDTVEHRRRSVKGLLDVDHAGSGSSSSSMSLRAARVVAVPDREHDPARDVRPPARDRGDEARRARRTGSCASRSWPRAWCRARRRRARRSSRWLAQALRLRPGLQRPPTASSAEFFVTTGDATWIAFLVLLIGVVIGVIGATIGLRRFLT